MTRHRMLALHDIAIHVQKQRQRGRGVVDSSERNCKMAQESEYTSSDGGDYRSTHCIVRPSVTVGLLRALSQDRGGRIRFHNLTADYTAQSADYRDDSVAKPAYAFRPKNRNRNGIEIELFKKNPIEIDGNS